MEEESLRYLDWIRNNYNRGYPGFAFEENEYCILKKHNLPIPRRYLENLESMGFISILRNENEKPTEFKIALRSKGIRLLKSKRT